MAKKDTSNAEPHNHQGSTAAQDKELSLFLDKLWARNEPPSRVEVFRMLGQNVRGEMIFHEDFNPKDKRDVEVNNKLANEIVAACQHDCDSNPRPKMTSYLLAVIDRNRTATPLTRRIGPMHPQRALALRTVDSIDSEHDDEESLNLQVLDLRRIKESNEQIRWDKQRNDSVVQGMLLLQNSIIENQQQMIDKMTEKWFMAVDKQQEAQDRSAQRDIMLEEKRFNLGMKKELIRSAKNLIPGLFAKDEPATTAMVPTQNGHAAPAGKPAPYGPSPERSLVDNFLCDIEDDPALNAAVFGDYEEREDGKVVPKTPGVFRFEQYRIMVGVRDGHLPVSAVDELLPESGSANAITMEQVTAAGAAGVTEGTAMAILELVRMRRAAKESAAAKAPAATPPSATT